MKILTLITLLTLTSCSMVTSRQIDYSESYVTGKNIGNKTSEEISNNLHREFTLAGGNYNVVAFPITKAYVNAVSNELAGARGFSVAGSKKLRKEMYKKYIDGKICIDAHINIREFEKVSNFSEWKVTYIDSGNIAYALEWLPEPPSISQLPRPITSTRNGYHGKESTWSLAGQACTDALVEIKKGFHLVFHASYVQWPYDNEHKEMWSFDYTEVINGVEVKKERKKRKKEGYRGW